MPGIRPFLVSILASLAVLVTAPALRAGVIFQSAELTARTIGYIGDGHWEKDDSLTSDPLEKNVQLLLEGSLFNSDSHGYTQAHMGLETFRDWTNFYLVEVTHIGPIAPDFSAGGATICEWTVRFTLNERQRFAFGVETLLEFDRSPSTAADPADQWEYSETFALLDARNRQVFDVHRESSDREVHLRNGVLGPGEYVLQVRSEFGFALPPPLTGAGVHSNFGGEIRFSPVPEPCGAYLVSAGVGVACVVAQCRRFRGSSIAVGKSVSED